MKQPHMPSRSLLKMQGIVKAFSGVRVLHEVDFEVGSGEVMALIGETGKRLSIYRDIFFLLD